MRTILVIIVLFINLCCRGQSKNQYENFTSTSKTMILNYDDFGPQILAYDFLGFEWWQWDNHRDSDPKTKYDIRVIIYKDVSLEIVKNKYPINRNSKVDFRYASYNGCIEYLDKRIKEFDNDFDVERYSDLRKKIVSHFKPKE
ncbi:hypothetical protein [Aquimarina algiphila]|uniref:hypothetical protein n=1 Tax=Aquimarina algiphila TaxID=2047982 RepID=UPI00232A82CA|nr:hypothetical protein [Aquimarina algiphila]